MFPWLYIRIKIKVKGHKSNECRKKWRNESNLSEGKSKSFALMINTENTKTARQPKIKCIIDSGCTDHIMNDPTLVPPKLFNQTFPINVAKEGETMEAIKIGTLNVSTLVGENTKEGTLNEVLVVPSSRQNLISVSQIDRKGGTVIFGNGVAKIFMGNELVGTGKLQGGLYCMDFNSVSKSCANLSEIPSLKEKNHLWHKRLGHLSMRNICKLKQLAEGIDLDLTPELEFCDSCVIANQKRRPFNKTRPKTSRPLQVIHSDVCGPSNVVSHDGYKYFVTFIDDYTHISVVFLMKAKSEGFECFQKFKAMAESHFSRYDISRLRCDGGGEYKSRVFRDFCAREGISMDYTTPHDPELISRKKWNIQFHKLKFLYLGVFPNPKWKAQFLE